MPSKFSDSQSKEPGDETSRYRPGYDWTPGYFGPPPGIPEAMKCEFDNMNDREYLYAFLRLSQEQKDSLMISEAERRRTFNAHWPIQHVVQGNDLAKEGFYYTGTADKVQCAFCCGIIRNWEKEDVPAHSHRAYFPYCNMVLKKPCFNIPFEVKECQVLVTEESSMKTKTTSYYYNDYGIYRFAPASIKFALLPTRLESFKAYSSSNPISAEELASAGFYFIGPADGVKCFYCDGELYNWAVGDDSWEEHAKWYPGCVFVRENKGASFIKQARSKMSKEDLETSQTLKYNISDLSFLESTINNAREHVNEGNQEESLPEIEHNPSKRQVDVTELLSRKDELSEEDSSIVIEALTCKICEKNEVGAVLLPCGHFIICQSCSRGELPRKCFGCGSIVMAACRVYTS